MSATSPSVNPLDLEPPGLTFEDLDELRAYLERTLESAQASLLYYYDEESGGFFHKIEAGTTPTPGKYSKASTATCLTFLASAGLLKDVPDLPWSDKLRDLRRTIVFDDDWSSADLDPDNPFTLSFLLEAIHVLSGGLENLDEDERERVNEKLDLLLAEVLRADGDHQPGGVRIHPYPPTAFLTQAAVRVLTRWDRLTPEARSAVESWTWRNLRAESVLVASGSPDADVFELAYSVVTASAVALFDRMTPQERSVIQYALGQFFESQNDQTGEWPRSRPLFLYPGIGYAYCFDYELLVQLLSDPQLFPLVYGKLKKLRFTAYKLDQKKYPLEKSGAYGWSSGHHGQRRFAESWSTASVFHFVFILQRYVAEAIRRDVFDYVGGTYSMPHTPPRARAQLPESFLDSRVKPGMKSLKRVVQTNFLQPLLDARHLVEEGRPLPTTAPVSAIFFGPPGTSKTELAKLIAESLGWPFLALDPSHLTRNGLDQVHAEAHRLFTMLQSCDQVVVLLDEFDELVREREREGQIESRFLTTAMLPKLGALSARRRIVFIIATNHLERFDVAIRRQGRFDMILPVRPPTATAKFKRWQILQRFVAEVAATDAAHAADLRKIIDDLTFLECQALVRKIEPNTELSEFTRMVTEDGRIATITQPVHPPPTDPADSQVTWRERVASEADRIRVPRP